MDCCARDRAQRCNRRWPRRPAATFRTSPGTSSRRARRGKRATMFSQFFIHRPIVACVISILIVILGGVAYRTLPVAQYPQIAPPVIRVTTVFPGASAQVIADTVAAPIEQQVNGVDKMLYMESTSA